MLRVYDIALATYLTLSMEKYDEYDQVLLSTDEIPMTFGTPRREFQEGTNSIVSGDFKPTAVEKIKVPSTTLVRLDSIFDYRRFTPAEWRGMRYSDDLTQVITARFPLPFNLIYQFEAWADTNHDLNRMQEHYMLKFPKPVWPLEISFPEPWGVHNVHLIEDNINNISVFEPGGDEERILRFAATITMEAWVPLPSEWKRTIMKYGLDILNQVNPNQILQSLETEYADKAEFWATGDKTQVLEWK